jgi:hypothetical protein
VVSRARTLARANYRAVVFSCDVRDVTQGARKCHLRHLRVRQFCGKDATKWLVCNHSESKMVDKCLNAGHKRLISPLGLGGRQNLWHSITRSSRSTCQRIFKPQGAKRWKDKGPRKRDGDLPTGSGVRSAGRHRRMTWSACHQRCSVRHGAQLVCLGNPEGRVSFGSLVTRGFRPSGDYLVDPVAPNVEAAVFGRHDRLEYPAVALNHLP